MQTVGSFLAFEEECQAIGDVSSLCNAICDSDGGKTNVATVRLIKMTLLIVVQ